MFSKKIILGFFLGLIICHLKADVKDGFYLGPSLIESFNHFTLRTKNSSTRILVERSENRNKTLGSIFFGYGYTWCRFYIAAELNGYFQKRSANIARPGVTLVPFLFLDKIAVRDYLAGDVLIGGRFINCLLVYLRGGTGWSKIKLHQVANAAANTPTFDADQSRLGLRAGVGVNYTVACHFGLGADYIFTHYKKFHAFWSQFNINFTEKAYAHYFSLSAIYSF